MKMPIASNRQLKLLKFFGKKPPANATSDIARRMISRIFMEKPHYRELWAKYKFITGDDDNDSPDLKPFDLEELLDLALPDDWKKSGSKKLNNKVTELVLDELKEGVPFEEPEPIVKFKQNIFVLSGIFNFGKKDFCYKEIVDRGGEIGNNVTRKTNYLIIGGNPNPNWSQEAYGNKIKKAFSLNLSGDEISIISEDHWVNSL